MRWCKRVEEAQQKGHPTCVKALLEETVRPGSSKICGHCVPSPGLEGKGGLHALL
jgi:hypothetical protein